MWKLLFIEADNFMFSPTKTLTEAKDEDWGTSYGFYARLLAIFAILAAIVSTLALWSFPTLGDMLTALGIPVKNLPADLRNLTVSLEISPIMAIFLFIIFALAGLIALPILSGWMHIWICLFSIKKPTRSNLSIKTRIWTYLGVFKKGAGQTFKAMAYGSTPNLLFGWIPLIGLIFKPWPIAVYLASSIFGIWQTVISIIAIRELHGISTFRAILAYLLGVIIVPTIIWAFLTLL
ncbi:MAG: YIP1 family protein [Candidatus Bathyarchaeia archaeon]